MNDDITVDINKNNISNIRRQIDDKKSSIPHYATSNQCEEVITDYDVFPYTRWYRGVPGIDVPIVAEREAGFRIRHDDCYKAPCMIENVVYPEHCFEAACSTVFPCRPDYLKKISDRSAMNIMVRDKCVTEYR